MLGHRIVIIFSLGRLTTVINECPSLSSNAKNLHVRAVDKYVAFIINIVIQAQLVFLIKIKKTAIYLQTA